MFRIFRSASPSSSERQLNARVPACPGSKQTAHLVSVHARAVASLALKACCAECFLQSCSARVVVRFPSRAQALPLLPVASTVHQLTQLLQQALETERGPPPSVVLACWNSDIQVRR